MSCSTTAPARPSSPPPPPLGGAAPGPKTPPPPPPGKAAAKPPPPPAKPDKRAVDVQPIPSVEEGVTLPAMTAEDASGVIPLPARFSSYEENQEAEEGGLEYSPPFTPQEADNPFRGLLAARALAQWGQLYCVTCRTGMVPTVAGLCGE
jgi:hypothetical protein